MIDNQETLKSLLKEIIREELSNEKSKGFDISDLKMKESTAMSDTKNQRIKKEMLDWYDLKCKEMSIAVRGKLIHAVLDQWRNDNPLLK